MNKDLALPAPPCSSSAPKVLVPSLFTNFLRTVVLFCVRRFILRHSALLLLPASNVHLYCFLFCLGVPPPTCSWGKGLGAQAGWVTYYPSAREGGALSLGCRSTSVQGFGENVDAESVGAIYMPRSATGEVAVICPSLGPLL